MKAPVNPYTGGLASVRDACAWSGFEQAQWAQKKYGCDGLGFALNGDGIIAIDLDDCVSWDHDRFHLSKQAEEIVRSLDSYMEFSPSRKGMHIWLFGCLPEAGRRNDVAHIEMYADKRYLTITGDPLPDSVGVLENRTKEVFSLYRQFFPGTSKNLGPGCAVERRLTVRPAHGYPRIVLDDNELLKRARSAKNGSAFSALFDESGLHGYASHSHADQALCNRLAFWSGDPEQMDRLFRRSARMREKWNRPDYRDLTIENALKRVDARYGGSHE